MRGTVVIQYCDENERSFAARTTVPRRSWTFVNVQSSRETDRMIPANGDVCFVLIILEHLHVPTVIVDIIQFIWMM